MNQRSKDPKLPPHAHKKELTKGKGGGRWRERERGGGGGRGKERKKNQKEKGKERKQVYNLIKAGTVAYLGRDAIATLWSKASRNIGLQSHEIVKAFTSMMGARTSVNFANLWSYISLLGFLTTTLKLYKLTDLKAFFAAVLSHIC